MVDPALQGLYPSKSLSRFADAIALCVQVKNYLQCIQLSLPPYVSNISDTAEMWTLVPGFLQPEPEFRPPMSEVVQSLVRLVQRANMTRMHESQSRRHGESGGDYEF
jgi:hypothetical protein